jgi:hypothetical protein
MPVPRQDYPTTWQEFELWFATEELCRTFLEHVRWPDGFVCPKCLHAGGWRTARGLWMCGSCGHQASVTAGTIFHRSRLPLRSWFSAMWFVCAQKNGVSALGLQRVLGFGSYETAWAWLHELRRVMVRPGRDMLGGPAVAVEFDTTFVGGRAGGRENRRRYANKVEVAIAVEVPTSVGFGRTRLAVIDSQERKAGLIDFARASIAPGTALRTDGDRLFRDLASVLDMQHDRAIFQGSTTPPHVVLPGVHRVSSLLKRWLAGTLHDGHAAGNLGYYLDEFTFRFNRRNSRARGLLFYRLVQQAVETDPHPLESLKSVKVTDSNDLS